MRIAAILIVLCVALSGCDEDASAAPSGASGSGWSAAAMTELFKALPNLATRFDQRWFYVEGDGMPAHPMMIGITNWQQQVPLPQHFTGDNAWQLPLHPRVADEPISFESTSLRSAVAMAVNGVPIFTAKNNRGEDSFLIGELDKWGGHCGRADDYHYHAAPLHLTDVVGKGKPIAFALDGFPIYGLTEPNGSPIGKLDSLNGHFDGFGHYHYHASKTYPYINGGLRGVVQIDRDEISPQPHTHPVRPAGRPLRGATITEFKSPKDDQWSLAYKHAGHTHRIDYRLNADGSAATFNFVTDGSVTRTETHDRPTGPADENDRRGRRPPPRRDDDGRRRPRPRP